MLVSFVNGGLFGGGDVSFLIRLIMGMLNKAC